MGNEKKEANDSQKLKPVEPSPQKQDHPLDGFSKITPRPVIALSLPRLVQVDHNRIITQTSKENNRPLILSDIPIRGRQYVEFEVTKADYSSLHAGVSYFDSTASDSLVVDPNRTTAISFQGFNGNSATIPQHYMAFSGDRLQLRVDLIKWKVELFQVYPK